MMSRRNHGPQLESVFAMEWGVVIMFPVECKLQRPGRSQRLYDKGLHEICGKSTVQYTHNVASDHLKTGHESCIARASKWAPDNKRGTDGFDQKGEDEWVLIIKLWRNKIGTRSWYCITT